METLRIKKDDVYRIEVNDKGEYIEFDLLDIELPMKLLNATEELKKQENIYQSKINELNKQYKDTKNKEYLAKRYDIERNHCIKLRKAFDNFLGEGACDKIFGSTNRIGMFDDFLEALEPHLDKIQINIKGIKEKLYKKYAPKDKKVL